MTIKHLSIPNLSDKDVARFYSKIDTSGDCHVWVATPDKDGYGTIKIARSSYRAHRIAYKLSANIDPGDLMVCHTCDNPPCVRPEHLFLGTGFDNQRDKWNKGRQNEAFNLPENKARGSRVNTSKLSEGQAQTVIERLKIGDRQYLIAKDLNVTRSSIWNIAHGYHWKHLPR